MNEEVLIPKDYHLLWSDEFDGNSLSNHWKVDNSEAVSIKDGLLIIDSSCCLSTYGIHEYTYGRFEVSLRVPYGVGFYPFFNLCSDEKIYGKWPSGGQIDIVTNPTCTTEKHYSSIHYKENNILEQGAYPFSSGTDSAKDFHTYACEWMPGRINFYVDGIDFFSTSIDEPFNHPMYLTLGMEVDREQTPLGQKGALVVDSVRVFQKDEYVIKKNVLPRRLIAVCGNWEDAENYNSFLQAIKIPELSKDYVIASFTFGSMYQHLMKDEIRMADFIENVKPAAIVIFAQMIKEEGLLHRLIEVGNRLDVPVFTLEKPHPGAIYLELDYDGGFENIVRHIVEYHGISDVDMFAGFRDNDFSNRRVNIYKKVLLENGIPFEERRIHYGDFWDATAGQVTEALISSGYKIPEAFICANDSMALGVTKALEKCGFRVPEDVKVVGMDGISAGQVNSPSITSTKPDYESVARTLISTIDEWKDISARSKLYKAPIIVNFKSLINESCGCEDRKTYEEKNHIISMFSKANNDCFRHISEMGKFVNESLHSDSLSDAFSNLNQYLWQWKDQYYYIGILGDRNRIKYPFYGRRNEFKYDVTVDIKDELLPDYNFILSVDSDINILYFKQIHIQTNEFIFVASGLKDVTLRSQQRFEEFALFVSSVINCVYKNQKYIRANKEIERMSEMDYLTGLYNRRGFFKSIHKSMKDQVNKPFSITLFSLDMDGLKYINDNYGHSAGDQAIQQMANAILRYSAGKGICARYGGDEFAFAIISSDLDPVDISFVRNSFDTILDSSNMMDSKPYKVACSIGCSFRIADGDFNLDEMLKEADSCMYEEKQWHKNQKE